MSGRNHLESWRRWGYLQAALDDLGRLPPVVHPELREAGEREPGRRWYAGSIGAEFMHLSDAARVQWIQERMEVDPPAPDARRTLELLLRGELFERTLQKRYIGTKRFSLEGSVSLIPLLAEAISRGGAEQVILATSHRGRLNLIANIVGRDPAEIFAQFEDVDPRSVLGGGDVKYHLGATGLFRTPNNGGVRIALVSNPSHVEAVDPVAMGRARAHQDRRGKDGRRDVLPITLHGDAAFAGQGVAAETLNMAELPGYTVGGTIHVVINNLIGFTTTPEALHSSRFATDVARRGQVPIFHVNAEDADAAVRVGRLAAEYRAAWGSDVVIDLIGYRKHGHSEVDDPALTQPQLYEKIRQLKPLPEAYAQRHGLDGLEDPISRITKEFEEALERAREMKERPALFSLPAYWGGYPGGPYDPSKEIDTGVAEPDLRAIGDALVRLPRGFSAHPKVLKGLEHRRAMTAGEQPIDWSTAEALALGSLVREGVRVRLTGEDTRRGTFNQRHATLFDIRTGAEHVPLAGVSPKQAPFEVYDSPLSEAAPLGFEFGYSRDMPDALVLWEAQFGDFVNGGQIVIDQFISSAEDKWGLLSGVVLLLPHGYEGQGPEHSSARIERFLQLAAEDNLQVCHPSTAAQYFHLLRRQVLRKWRKPLIVFTPKSALRLPAAASPRSDLASGRFLPVLDETRDDGSERVLICSGKIAHELREERESRGLRGTRIVTLEQLYPFPEAELSAILDRHAGARDVAWVQEEPGNMGALSFVRPRLERLLGGRPLRRVHRSSSASPATGSKRAHDLEQAALLALAFLDGGGSSE